MLLYSSYDVTSKEKQELFFFKVKWPEYEAEVRMNGIRTPFPIRLLGLCRGFTFTRYLKSVLFVRFFAAVWECFTADKGNLFCFSLNFIQFARPGNTSALKMSLDKIFCVATLLRLSSLCPNFAVQFFLCRPPAEK